MPSNPLRVRFRSAFAHTPGFQAVERKNATASAWKSLQRMLLCVGILGGFAALGGCTSTVAFRPVGSTSKPDAAETSLAVSYTSGTLFQVYGYRVSSLSLTRYDILTGKCLEAEIMRRVGPRVRQFVLAQTPKPDGRHDYFFEVGIKNFEMKGGSAEVILSARLYNRDGAVLLERDYQGSGTNQLPNLEGGTDSKVPYLHQTTREAISAAVEKIVRDMKPFLPSPRDEESGDRAAPAGKR